MASFGIAGRGFGIIVILIGGDTLMVVGGSSLIAVGDVRAAN
jgi:hypothetical protein